MEGDDKKVPQALFLDRDGTLIKWVHYLSDPAKVELIDGVAEALGKAKAAGCMLFLHTNQSGVGRGYFGMDAVEAVNERMFELLGLGKDVFEEVCIATDDPDRAGEDSYRKPNARFEREMINQFVLKPEYCCMVGDSNCDMNTATNAGMQPVFVRSNAYTGPVPSKASEFTSLLDFVRQAF